MQTIINPTQNLNIGKTAVAIGTFDGLHKGHIALIDELSKDASLIKAVMTFRNNPLNISAGADVKYIITQEQKEEILVHHGVDIMIAQDFNQKIMNTEAEEFFEKFLIKILNPKKIIVGYDFTFGKNKRGTPSLLQTLCDKAGIELCVIPPVTVNGEIVSSTLIRSKITSCDFDGAAAMLGRPFEVRDRVICGNCLGRKLGFPTVNQAIDSTMVMPQDGVYITSVTIDGKFYPSVTNIGGKPTIQEGYRGIETHIIGYDGDLYGKELAVRFYKRTRNVEAFENIDDLKAAVNTDISKAVRYFGMA